MNTPELIETAERLSGAAQEARQWIDSVRGEVKSVANEAGALVNSTRQLANLARKVRNSAGRSNCVGVFGPSQAGKSYLVSALARPANGRLTADLVDRKADFLTEINPPGDRESTGLVTRFTAKPSKREASHPVELRLLSETDLVKVFANSFFSDFDPNNMTVAPPDEDRIRAMLVEAEAAARGESAAHLDEVTMFDLAEYFRRYFPSRIASLDRAEYWDGVLRLAPRLSLERRAKLYAALWAEIAPFTELFIHLARALETLSFAGEACADLTALVPRETSIIDVQVLAELANESATAISVRPLSEKGTPGTPVSVPRATLAALVAEIRIVMTEKPWAFFEHTDLLDFPGARSRLKLVNLPAEADDRARQVRELLLRGKIAYLFQRFTEERELTAMLLCMPPSVAEVKDLAGMVRSWIDITHGADPIARRKVKNALFLVLTKFDLEFLEKGGETSESRRGKWERRLHASFLELYGKDGWPEDWDGKPFDNALFLRNPGMKQEHLMDYAQIGRGADGSEVLLEASAAVKKQDLIGEYARAFLESPLCKRHFAQIQHVWDAAFTPNDGGVTFLVERLNGVLDPDLKRRQLEQRLFEQSQLMSSELSRFYHADSDQKRRETDLRLVELRRQLAAALRGPNANYNRVASFVESLMMPEADIRQVYLNVAALKLDDSVSAPPKAVDDPWADEEDQAGTPAPQIARDRPAIFAERLFNHWTEKLHAASQNATLLRRLGIDTKLFSDVAREIIVGAHRKGVDDAIVAELRISIQSAAIRWDQAVERAVLVSSSAINDYVHSLGFGDLPEAARPGFPEPPKEPRQRVFTAPLLEPGLPTLGDKRLALEEVYFRDWGVAFRQAGLANVSFAGGREFTEEQNARLGAVLAALTMAH
jgi:hypothetical protein